MTIGSMQPRGIGLSQSTAASQPGKNSGPSSKGETHPQGAGKPGSEPPHQLHDSQPEGAPKMGMMDKLSGAANVAGAAASIYPMFQGNKDGKPPTPGNGEPGIEDKAEYNKYKLLTSVGPPPINW